MAEVVPRGMTIIDEDKLWARFRGDDPEDAKSAREEIILMYQDLVDGIAFKFKSRLPPYILVDDLLSYAQIGLLKAVDTYDESKGAFRSYASMKVYGAVMDEFRSQDWAPRGLRRDERALNEAKSQLGSERPTIAQISNHLGWEAARVESTIRRVQNSSHLSLDYVQAADPSYTSLDAPGGLSDPEEEAQTSALCDLFVETLETLSPTGQEVMARRYFYGQTLTEVARDINLPLTSIRRIHSEAVEMVLVRVSAAVVAA